MKVTVAAASLKGTVAVVVVVVVAWTNGLSE